MAQIKKVKTFYGVKYAVVEPFKHTETHLDKNGKQVSETKVTDFAVEYKVGKNIVPAIFDVTAEGLAEAKEVQKLFNK